jgi:hypothetical protein
VRIALPGDWEKKISDEQLVDRIRAQLHQAS